MIGLPVVHLPGSRLLVAEEVEANPQDGEIRARVRSWRQGAGDSDAAVPDKSSPLLAYTQGGAIEKIHTDKCSMANVRSGQRCLAMRVPPVRFCVVAPRVLACVSLAGVAASPQAVAEVPSWSQMASGNPFEFSVTSINSAVRSSKLSAGVLRREQASRKFLRSTTAEAARLISRSRFDDLNRGQALEAAKAVFGIDRPAWEPPTLRLGEHLLDYVDDDVMRIERSDGQVALIESSLPLWAEDELGNNERVSVALVENGDDYQPENPLTDSTISKQPSEGFELTAQNVRVRPIGLSRESAPILVGDKVFFANVLEDTDWIVTPLPLGVEASWQLRSPEAPSALNLRIDSPANSTITVDPHSGDLVVDGAGQRLATLSPVRAVDAQGRDVPASYGIYGSTITVEVDHDTGDYAYPILVDPVVSRTGSASANGWYLASTAPGMSLLSAGNLREWISSNVEVRASTSEAWGYHAPGDAYVVSLYQRTNMALTSANVCMIAGLSANGTSWSPGWNSRTGSGNGQICGPTTAAYSITECASASCSAITSNHYAFIDLYAAAARPGAADFTADTVIVTVGDNNPPSMSVPNVPSGWTKSDSLSGSFGAVDTGLGLSKMSVRLDGYVAGSRVPLCGDTSAGFCPASGWQYLDYSITEIGDGAHTLSFFATDPVLNGSGEPGTYGGPVTKSWLIDTRGPSGSMNLADAVVKGTTSFSGSMTDESSGPGSWSLEIKPTSSSTWQTACSTASPTSGSTYGCSVNTATYADGIYDIRAKMTDQVSAANGGPNTSSTSPISVRIQNVPPSNAAAPTVSGTSADGQTLTASSGTWSGTPLASTDYQWQRCDSVGDGCANLGGQRGSAYTATSVDIGHTLRVSVTVNNIAGSATATSAPSGPILAIVPINSTAPSISGTPLDGRTLTATTGAWSGSPVLTTTGQWQRCDLAGAHCSAIGGSAGPTYVLGNADIGKTIRVAVTACNSAGCGIGTSSTQGPVGAVQPSVLSVPMVSGTPSDGEALVGSNGTWDGSPITSRTYKWRRCDGNGGACADISGETTNTHLVTATDVEQTLRMVVTACNAAGCNEATSLSAGPVAPAPPSNTGVPTITGTPTDGATIVLDRGAWAGTPPNVYSYHWRRCDAVGVACATIVGQDSLTYRATSSDIGHTLRAAVTATNPAGAATVTTAPTEAVAAVVPSSTSAPSISGDATYGKLLTATAGDWSGSPVVTTTYQWRRCDAAGDACSDIADASKSTYRATSADVAKTLRILLTACNSSGCGADISAPTNTVLVASPVNTQLPEISGPALDGHRLIVTPGTWTDPGSISIDRQWRACDANGEECVDIEGETASTFRLTGAVIGNALRLSETACNAAGGCATEVSAATTPVELVTEANAVSTTGSNAWSFTADPTADEYYDYDLAESVAMKARPPALRNWTGDPADAVCGIADDGSDYSEQSWASATWQAPGTTAYLTRVSQGELSLRASADFRTELRESPGGPVLAQATWPGDAQRVGVPVDDLVPTDSADQPREYVAKLDQPVCGTSISLGPIVFWLSDPEPPTVNPLEHSEPPPSIPTLTWVDEVTVTAADPGLGVSEIVLSGLPGGDVIYAPTCAWSGGAACPTTATHVFTLDARELPAGPLDLSVTAKDPLGHVSEARAFSVEIEPVHTPDPVNDDPSPNGPFTVAVGASWASGQVTLGNASANAVTITEVSLDGDLDWQSVNDKGCVGETVDGLTGSCTLLLAGHQGHIEIRTADGSVQGLDVDLDAYPSEPEEAIEHAPSSPPVVAPAPFIVDMEASTQGYVHLRRQLPGSALPSITATGDLTFGGVRACDDIQCVLDLRGTTGELDVRIGDVSAGMTLDLGSLPTISPPDNVPAPTLWPSVYIPQNENIFGGGILKVQYYAYDADGISEVRLIVDGSPVDTLTFGCPPISVSGFDEPDAGDLSSCTGREIRATRALRWNSAGAADGNHTVAVVVRDTRDREVTSEQDELTTENTPVLMTPAGGLFDASGKDRLIPGTASVNLSASELSTGVSDIYLVEEDESGANRHEIAHAHRTCSVTCSPREYQTTILVDPIAQDWADGKHWLEAEARDLDYANASHPSFHIAQTQWTVTFYRAAWLYGGLDEDGDFDRLQADLATRGDYAAIWGLLRQSDKDRLLADTDSNLYEGWASRLNISGYNWASWKYGGADHTLNADSEFYAVQIAVDQNAAISSGLSVADANAYQAWRATPRAVSQPVDYDWYRPTGNGNLWAWNTSYPTGRQTRSDTTGPFWVATHMIDGATVPELFDGGVWGVLNRARTTEAVDWCGADNAGRFTGGSTRFGIGVPGNYGPFTGYSVPSIEGLYQYANDIRGSMCQGFGDHWGMWLNGLDWTSQPSCSGPGRTEASCGVPHTVCRTSATKSCSLLHGVAMEGTDGVGSRPFRADAFGDQPVLYVETYDTVKRFAHAAGDQNAWAFLCVVFEDTSRDPAHHSQPPHGERRRFIEVCVDLWQSDATAGSSDLPRVFEEDNPYQPTDDDGRASTPKVPRWTTRFWQRDHCQFNPITATGDNALNFFAQTAVTPQATWMSDAGGDASLLDGQLNDARDKHHPSRMFPSENHHVVKITKKQLKKVIDWANHCYRPSPDWKNDGISPLPGRKDDWTDSFYSPYPSIYRLVAVEQGIESTTSLQYLGASFRGLRVWTRFTP